MQWPQRIFPSLCMPNGNLQALDNPCVATQPQSADIHLIFGVTKLAEIVDAVQHCPLVRHCTGRRQAGWVGERVERPLRKVAIHLGSSGQEEAGLHHLNQCSPVQSTLLHSTPNPTCGVQVVLLPSFINRNAFKHQPFTEARLLHAGWGSRGSKASHMSPMAAMP